jgi:hypothetical protein
MEAATDGSELSEVFEVGAGANPAVSGVVTVASSLAESVLDVA